MTKIITAAACALTLFATASLAAPERFFVNPETGKVVDTVAQDQNTLPGGFVPAGGGGD